MLAYERKYYDQGAQYIAGIDEAGRDLGRAVGDSGCYFTAGGIYQRT